MMVKQTAGAKWRVKREGAEYIPLSLVVDCDL